MIYDNKHIKRTSVPLFAKNIKVALRKAYGMLPFLPGNNDTSSAGISHKNNNVDDHVRARMKSLAGYDIQSNNNKQEIIYQIINSLKALL